MRGCLSILLARSSLNPNAKSSEFRDYLKAWFTESLKNIGTKDFSITWVEFKNAWKRIKTLEGEILSEENSIKEFDNLLYQNISTDPEIIRKAYSLLSSKVAKLDKSKIKEKISKADFPFTFFDGKIDAGEIEIQKLPTIKELQDDVETKKKEL